MRKSLIYLSLFSILSILFSCYTGEDREIRTTIMNFYDNMFRKNRNALAAYNLVSQQPLSNKLQLKHEPSKEEQLLMYPIDGKVDIVSAKATGDEAIVEVKYNVLDPVKANKQLWQMIFNSRTINKETYENIKKDTNFHSETVKFIYLHRENGSWKILFPNTVLESLKKEAGVTRVGPMPAPSMDTFLLEPGVENYVIKMIKNYVDIKNLKRVPQEPYIRGKAVIIDVSAGRPHELHYTIPADIVAKNPEEVGTVIWIQGSSKHTGLYTHLRQGYVTVWKVTIIDRSTNTIVSEKVFQGPDLPAVVKGTDKGTFAGRQFFSAEETGITITDVSIVGKPPIDEVRNYIQRLHKH
jgi:hypothetical protein